LNADDARFGFIVMDTNGALFGILHDNARDVITKFTVDLPKKRSRGGASTIRFARIRKEKRQNYVRKVSETALQCFITDENMNVDGIIVANVAELSTELQLADVFDPVSCIFSFIIITAIEIYVLSVFKRKFFNESSFSMAMRLVSIKRLN
jgi:peptide subunit release factor 1 (eRF1)